MSEQVLMRDHPEGFVKWEDVHKKEARGQNDLDLGEVNDIGPTFVHTVRGVGNRTDFYIPKYLVQGFDGKKVWFNVAEGEVNQFMREQAPNPEDYRSQFGPLGAYPNIEFTVPVIQEPDHGRWATTAPFTGSQQTDLEPTPRRSTTPTVGRLGEPTAGVSSPGPASLTREDVKRASDRRDENEY